MSVKAVKLEEKWTSTTIQTAFTFHLTSPKSSDFSVDLPLLPHLGWTFTLSLSPRLSPKQKARKQAGRLANHTYDCTPVALSFRKDGSSNPWGDTSLQAQLSLDMEQHDSADTMPIFGVGIEQATQNSTSRSPMSLGILQVALSRDSSMVLPLTTAGFISLQQPTKIWLDVTISGCPFSGGLFRTDSPNHDHEAEADVQLVRQCGDRLLTWSLATGKHFDVKFLSPSTRPAKTERLQPTYASLLVLRKKVDLLSSKLGDDWKNVLSAPKHGVKADIKHVGEMLCPHGYEHELDSDLDEEDSDEPQVTSIEDAKHPLPNENDTSIRREEKPQSLDCGTERLNDSTTSNSFELHQPEEIIQDSEVPLAHSIGNDDDQRTYLVKFAAHRTWHAFLWYCYTGHVEFGQLRSQHGARLPNTDDRPPPCSPKSMYRLADLVGNQDLKNKALGAIKERVNKENILEEIFSVFTFKYPDVRQAQMNILLKYIGSPEVKDGFVNLMKNFGGMPHAEPVLLALCDKLARCDSES